MNFSESEKKIMQIAIDEIIKNIPNRMEWANVIRKDLYVEDFRDFVLGMVIQRVYSAITDMMIKKVMSDINLSDEDWQTIGNTSKELIDSNLEKIQDVIGKELEKL